MKKYLGIDYGTKRIGLAFNVASLADPYLVISNRETPEKPIVSQEALNKLISICREEEIEEIVLGVSEAEMAHKIEQFAKIIGEKINLPIHLIDETLSSHEVGRRMKEAGFSLKKRQGEIDHYAAALILEEFIENLPR